MSRYKNHKGNVELWIEYKKSKAIFIKAASEAKKESWTRFLDQINSKNNSKEVWNHIRKLRSKKTARRIILKQDDTIITE